MNNQGILYAIFKNGVHKGNVRASNKTIAIRYYVVESMLYDYINCKEFMRQYSAEIAINGLHHHYLKNSENLN